MAAAGWRVLAVQADLTSTDKPGPSASSGGADTAMRNGTRWVTLMNVPETPSAGIRLNSELVARRISVTRPLRRSAG